MSRHNRRRVRGANKAFRSFLQRDDFELPTLPKPESSDATSLTPPSQSHARRGVLTARHWHNRYIAWQTRDRRQREERQKLMEDRKRIFGGESDEGDDEDLCVKMMEYFNGLDYIEG